MCEVVVAFALSSGYCIFDLFGAHSSQRASIDRFFPSRPSEVAGAAQARKPPRTL